MRSFVFLFFSLAVSSSFASLPLEATLEEMASQADHILIGRVTGVDMIDGNGKQIVDGEAMTGPGLKNTIRLRVAVQEVLVSNTKNMPEVLMVPLDPFMHFSLHRIKSAESGDKKPFLLLLKGKDFQPIKPGRFGRPLTDRVEALKIHKAAHQGSAVH